MSAEVITQKTLHLQNPVSRQSIYRFSKNHFKLYLATAVIFAAIGHLLLLMFPVLALWLPAKIYALISQADKANDWIDVSRLFCLLLLSVAVSWALLTLRFKSFKGMVIDPDKHPMFRRLLKDLQQHFPKLKTDHITITMGYGIDIIKTPVFYWPAPCKQSLQIGAQSLFALSPGCFRTLLARRAGQAAGEHHKTQCWLYYLDSIWSQYANNCARQKSFVYIPLKWLFTFYSRKYSHFISGIKHTYEIEGDRYAREIVHVTDFSRAIIFDSMAHNYLSTHYWPKANMNYADGNSDAKNIYSAISKSTFSHLGGPEMKSVADRIMAATDNADNDLPSFRTRLRDMGLTNIDRPLIPHKSGSNAATIYLGNTAALILQVMNTLWHKQKKKSSRIS